MEILRDPVWQFVGALLAVIAIVITVLIFYREKSRRELAFGMLSSRTVIAVDSAMSGRIQITLDGHPVGDVHLAVCALKNTGNTPFTEDDFSRSPRIDFGSDSRILDAQITKQFPENLNASVEYDEQSIRIKPLLMNSGEFFVVQALVSGPSPQAHCDLRAQSVTGLATLTRSSSVVSNIRPNLLRVTFMVICSLGILVGFFFRDAHSLLIILLMNSTGWSFKITHIAFFALLGVLTFFVAFFITWWQTYISSRQRRYVDDV